MSEKEMGAIGEIRMGEYHSFTSNVNALQVKEKPLPAAKNALDKGLAKAAVLQQFHFRVDRSTEVSEDGLPVISQVAATPLYHQRLS